MPYIIRNMETGETLTAPTFDGETEPKQWTTPEGALDYISYSRINRTATAPWQVMHSDAEERTN